MRGGDNAKWLLSLIAVAVALAPAAWGDDAPAAEPEKKPPVVIDFPLRHNLDKAGKVLGAGPKKAKGWVESDFWGKASVRVEGDTVIIEKGNDMTGIRWTGPLARMNYEISLEAKRVDGSDFFCGLTFPYGKEPCSLVVGGWGGTVVGISSLDWQDAYNNETARFMEFEKDRWYEIRLRVTPQKIEAWIDDESIVDVETSGRHISIRFECEPSLPLGIATWRTTGAIRNVRLNAFKAQASESNPAEESTGGTHDGSADLP